VSGPLASSLAQLLERLDELVAGEAAWPSPDTGFAAHVFARLRRDPPAAVQAALERGCRVTERDIGAADGRGASARRRGIRAGD
jgi:hypothetical protein